MALGRGLGALIPQQKQTIKSKKQDVALAQEPKADLPIGQAGVNFVEINQIVPNPRQPREFFADAGMEDLVSSVKEHGILQPLIVSPLGGGKYELIAGERRWRAARFSKMKQVPVVVREASTEEKLILALIENLQRQDLNPIEEAKGYKQLVDEFGFTHGQVATKMGKSRPVVANTLRLLNLSEEMQKALMRGKISASAGRVLAGVADKAKQQALFEKILQGLTVRESEIKSRLAKPASHIRRSSKDPVLLDMEEKLRESLKTKVDIKRFGKTYQLAIECYSEEELKKIAKKLL
ncbi:ParB/RepB/Spo0J family partition protein [Patescibacteria group bacterium]|nr:ParB/RepB/Spo0J family partition protein [Patescibacteria group bacterium]